MWPARWVEFPDVGEISAARPLLAVTLLVASAGLVFSAPASAGCVTQNVKGKSVQYCDQPRRPNGTWDRCRLVLGVGIDFELGPSGDTVLSCYPFSPSRAFWNGEPGRYIEP